MKVLLFAAGIIAYLAIGYIIAKYMGGDRSGLSADVTYLDWLGFGLILLFWPLIPLLVLFSFLRWVAGGSH
jgi:hypothetical protein